MKRISAILAIIGFSLIMTNCKSGKMDERYDNSLEKPWKMNVLMPPDIQYFPIDAFKFENDSVDTQTHKYYRDILWDTRYFHYHKGFKGHERYRVILNDPDRDIIVVEFEKRKEEMNMNWKVLDRDVDTTNNRRNILLSKEMELKENEWKKMKKLMAKTDFFNLPTNIFTKEEMDLQSIPDKSAEWVIEGDLDKNYHVIKRRYFGKRDPIMKALEYVFSLTDLEYEF